MYKIFISCLFIISFHSLMLCQSGFYIGVAEDFGVKMINDLEVSPDGSEAVFVAVGKVYLMNLKEGVPKRLTKGKQEYEFEPSFSADGNRIIFASWNASGYGKIHIYDKDTKWKKTALITSGIYRDPQFSQDGRFVTYKKEIEVAKVDTANQKTEGLYFFDLDDGDPIKLSSYGDNPEFTVDGKRVLYQSGTYRFGSFVKTFESVKLDGSDKQTLFYGKYGHEYSISPNYKWIAWQELGKIYVAPFPEQPVGLSADNESIEIEEVSDLPGNNLGWSDEGAKLNWTIANKLYTVDLESTTKQNMEEIKLSHPADIPAGVLAFTNARIITMNGDEVIEHGTIIVKDNKIIDLGFDIQVPKEAHAINCSGKTIIPGLIDLNPTSNNYDYNLSPIQEWEYIELLRTGITTKLDGGFKIANGMANRELVLAGKLIGPRLLNGGVTIGAMDEDLFTVESYEHYKKSNLHIAQSFGVTAVQSDQPVELGNIMQLANAQSDTTLVQSDDMITHIITKSNEGADKLKLLHKYTLHNATLVGLEDQIGSIEKGKIADIIIVDGNPLESIGQLSKVTHTVKNGRVYECATMEEVGNYRKRISRTPNSAIYESLNRAMGSACCGFQH